MGRSVIGYIDISLAINSCLRNRPFVLLLLFVDGGVGLITRTESDRRPYTGKIPR